MSYFNSRVDEKYLKSAVTLRELRRVEKNETTCLLSHQDVRQTEIRVRQVKPCCQVRDIHSWLAVLPTW